MSRSKKQSLSQRAVGAASLALPAPLRAMATNRVVASLIVMSLPVLLATGVVSLEWKDGMPSLSFNRQRAQEVRREAAEKVQEYRAEHGGAPVAGAILPALAGAQGWGQRAQQPAAQQPAAPAAAWPAPATQPAVSYPSGGWGAPATQPPVATGWGYAQPVAPQQAPSRPFAPPPAPAYGAMPNNAWQGRPQYR